MPTHFPGKGASAAQFLAGLRSRLDACSLTPKMSGMTRTTDLNLERIAEMVLEIDRLTKDIAPVLGKLRSAEANALTRSLPLQSQALRLAISMEKEPAQLRPQASELERSFRRIERLSLGARIPATGKVALMLGIDLAAQLVAELAE